MMKFRNNFQNKNNIQLSFEDLFKKSTRMLGVRDYFSKRMEEKLLPFAKNEEDVSKVIEKLTELGYLNDLNYAKRILDVYKEKKSTRFIKNKLIEKGASKDIIDKVINNGESNEEEIAIEFAVNTFLKKRKLETKIINKIEIEKYVTDLCRFLNYRGFSYESIINATKNFRSFLKEKNNN